MNAVEKPETFVDGPLYSSRKKVYPQAVHGRFRRIKWAFMAVALGLYYLCRSYAGIAVPARRARRCWSI